MPAGGCDGAFRAVVIACLTSSSLSSFIVNTSDSRGSGKRWVAVTVRIEETPMQVPAANGGERRRIDLDAGSRAADKSSTNVGEEGSSSMDKVGTDMDAEGGGGGGRGACTVGLNARAVCIAAPPSEPPGKRRRTYF